MFDLWDLIIKGDLGTRLHNLIEKSPQSFIAVIVAILVFLGAKMVSGQPALRAWGLRLGVAVFLLYGSYTYLYEPAETRDAANIALRSANVGGIVLALTWIVLPILSFLYNHLRLALATFLGYTGYAIVTAEEFQTEQMPDIALRALMAVALALTVAWILHPIWDFFRDLLPRPRRQKEKVEEELQDEEAPEKPGRREQRRHREAAVVEAAKVTVEVPAEPPPAPVAKTGDAERRREKARMKIELLYVMAMPEIEQRIPRPIFNDLFNRYLGDHLSGEDIDENCQLLEVIMQQQRRPLHDHASASLRELLHRFLEEPKALHALETRPAPLPVPVPVPVPAEKPAASNNGEHADLSLRADSL